MDDVAPHDLLRLREGVDFACPAPLPGWILDALNRAPFVVVRRAPLLGGGLVPVGVRGPSRRDRFAAHVPIDAIAERITPEQLADARPWRGSPRRTSFPALRGLEVADRVLSSLGLCWGPIGSVGFELASGLPTTSLASDLDLLLRCHEPLSVSAVRRLLAALAAAPVRVDTQIETPNGAVALTEYARGEAPMLLRTTDAPRLVADPWTPAFSEEVS